MKKSLFILWISSVFCIATGYAQRDSVWTEQDSLWLRDVLSGKKKIRLNEATRRAIESGTLIVPEGSREAPELTPELRSYGSYLEITEDFSGVGLPDSLVRRPLYKLPPAVLAIYGMHAAWQPEPEFRSCKLYTVFPVERGLSGGGAGIIFVFSVEDVLEQIFWKSARAKKHNAKHATAWRYYNSIP